MTAGSFYELRDNLKTEKIDIGFMSEYAARGFDFTPVIKDELVVLLPRGHRLAKKKSISIQELKKENIIITSEGLDFEIGDILEQIGVDETTAKYMFDDDIVIMKFVELGFGICILPRLFLDVVGKEFDVEIKSFCQKRYRILGITYPNKEHMPLISTKFAGKSVTKTTIIFWDFVLSVF